MRTGKRINAPTDSTRSVRLAPALLLVVVAASAHAGSIAVLDADVSRISVTSVGGNVDFTMGGNAVEVVPNDTVLLPARIVTGPDGNVGLTQARTKVIVANDSEVEIPAEAVDGNLIARLVQHRGNVFYDVAPRDLGKLRVETPFLVAVIKGTQFNVAVDDDGTTISLFEGSLEIRTPDDSDIIELNAGEIAIRSLIDDSIRIIGMDDERVAIPPAAAEVEPPAAADATPFGATPAADSVADEAVVVRTNSNDVVAVEAAPPAAAQLDAARVDIDEAGDSASIRMNSVVDLAIDLDDSVVDAGRDAGVDIRGNGHIRGDAGDVKLDPGIDLGGTLPVDVGAPGVDLRIDAGLDLGGPLEADPALDLGTVVETGANLELDTGIVDVGGGLDVDLNVDLGSTTEVDIDVDVGARKVAPRGPRGARDGLLGALPQL